MFPPNFYLPKPVNIRGDLDRLKFPLIAMPDLPGVRFCTAFSGERVTAFDQRLRKIEHPLVQDFVNNFHAGFEGVLWFTDPSLDNDDIFTVKTLNFTLTDDWFSHIDTTEDRLKFTEESVNIIKDRITGKYPNINLEVIPSFFVTDLDDALSIHHTNYGQWGCGTLFKHPDADYFTGKETLRLDPFSKGVARIVEISYRENTLTLDSLDFGLFIVPYNLQTGRKKLLGGEIIFTFLNQHGNPKPVYARIFEEPED